jgi:hypothetical protein
MKPIARWALGIVGAAVLVFGILCLNYTKMGSVERHTQVAQEHGWPPPSRNIVYLGMFLAPLGGGLVGFAIGSRHRAA